MNDTINIKEDEEFKELLEVLGSKDGMARKNAREQLVAKGRPAIDFLIELVEHPKHTYRWEAIKTLEEMDDPITIPLLIQGLEDEDHDIRWIAAEGLIKLGKQSVKPLLEEIVERSDAAFLVVGAHHVFYGLRKADKLPAEFPINKLLQSLKNNKWMETVKPMAYELLNSFEE